MEWIEKYAPVIIGMGIGIGMFEVRLLQNDYFISTVQNVQGVHNFCASGCRLSLKPPVPEIFIGPIKILVHFLFALKQSFTKKAVYLVSYAVSFVFLL